MRTLADSECVMRHAGTIQSPREDVGPVPDKLSKISNNKKPGAMAAARAGRETGNSLPNRIDEFDIWCQQQVSVLASGKLTRRCCMGIMRIFVRLIRPRHRTEFCAQLMVRGLPGKPVQTSRKANHAARGRLAITCDRAGDLARSRLRHNTGSVQRVAVERSESRNRQPCGPEPVCPARCSASCAPAPRLLGLAVRRIGSVAFRHRRCAGAMPAQKNEDAPLGGTPCSRYSIDALG
jgi:hypothetical protein